MQRILDSIFNTSVYPNSVDRNRAGMIYALCMLILASYTLYAVTIAQWPVNGEAYTLWGSVFEAGVFNVTSILFLALYGLAIFTFIATRQGYLNSGSWGLVSIWYVSGVILNMYAQDNIEALGLAFGQLILLAALVRQERGLLIITPISLLTLWAGYGLRGGQEPVADIILMSINIISVSIVIWLFLRFFRLSFTYGVAEAIEERTRSAAILSEASQLVAKRVPSPQFMHEIAVTITKNFKHIQNTRIFLVDNEYVEAILNADSGQPILTPEKRVQYGVGGLSTVGQAIFRESHLINRPVESKVVEAVFPLRIGERIIGALELRSASDAAYSRPDVITVFQSLADNLSLAIDNILQFERAEQRLQDNQILVEQTRSALNDVERLNQRLTGNVWSQYLRSLEDGVGMSLDLQGDQERPHADSSWTSSLSEAFRNNHLVQEQKDNTQVIAMPLRVRGQVIGAMEFEIDSERGFTPEDMELLQEVSERFGMAADNTRLLEESSLIARREALVNQISTRLQSASSVNATLVEAARGLREALKAGKVAIRLGTPPAAAQEDNAL